MLNTSLLNYKKIDKINSIKITLKTIEQQHTSCTKK